MKQIKLVLMCTAVCVAVLTAYAKRPAAACESAQQYVKWGPMYVPVNNYGIDYTCIYSAGICTYYQPDPIAMPNGYVPCRTGTFSFIY
jgi:hypothetical protein